MKKNILLQVLFFIVFQGMAGAQTITGITVRPASNNSINIYTHIDLLYDGIISGHQIAVMNDTIYIKICSEEGPETAVTPVIDTEIITINPSLSHYFLSVKAYSYNYTNGNCDYVNIYDSAFHEFNTPVTDSTHFLNVAGPVKRDDVTIYPNPAQQQVIISGNCTACELIDVVNPLGQKIYEGVYNHTMQTINVSSFASGIYFLYFKNKNSEILSCQKILKQ